MKLLTLPHENDNLALEKMLSGKLKRLAREKKCDDPREKNYWPAEFFGLKNCQLFLKSNNDTQQSIVKMCNENILTEAYFIEKLGISYCARMVLLADNIETAQAFSLLGADEATHLRWLTPYVDVEKSTSAGAFLNFIATLVTEGNANCLVYLLQIILEGWGLHHYQLLANHCVYAPLKNVFRDILRDEALHHYTGSALFNPNKLSKQDEEFILENLACFLEMIRIGPQTIVQSVEQVLGSLSKQDKISIFQELSGADHTNQKLQLIKKLMLVPGMEKFVSYLDEKNLFQTYRASACLLK